MNEDTLNLLRQSKNTYGTEFENHLFGQYKLYVDMADRVSSRRMLANSFFVGGTYSPRGRLYRTDQRKDAAIVFARLGAFCRVDASLLCLVERCKFVPTA